MSVRFQADNDLSRRILSATYRREPGIDFQSAQTAQLDSLDDQAVLAFAASEDRILVTHDKRTMPRALAEFVAAGNRSPGVLLVIPQDAPCHALFRAAQLVACLISLSVATTLVCSGADRSCFLIASMHEDVVSASTGSR